MNYQKNVELGNVAMFIGAALNHPIPLANGRRGTASTIQVAQYKVKFNDIRIYCSLAHPSLVEEYWRSMGKEGVPSQEFSIACLKHDAMHYRQVYTAMLKLLPDDLKPNVVSCADYWELLYDTPEELRQYVESVPSRANPQYILSRWKVEDVTALKNFLFSVCHFSAAQ